MQEETTSGVENAAEAVVTPENKDFDASKPYHLSLKDADDKQAEGQSQEQAEPVKEPTAPEAGDDAEYHEQERPKKGGFQKKIERLAAENQAQVRRNQELEAELSKYRPQPNQNQEAKVQDGAPNANDPKYQTETGPLDYLADVTEWRQEQKQIARDKAALEAKQNEEFETRLESVKERETDFVEKFPDYHEKVDQAVELGLLTQDVAKTIVMNSDQAEAVAYHLATHPSDLQMLTTVYAKNMPAAIRLIEQALGQQPAAPPAKQTDAPRPITPVKAAGNTSSRMPDASTSLAQYEKWKRS